MFRQSPLYVICQEKAKKPIQGIPDFSQVYAGPNQSQCQLQFYDRDLAQPSIQGKMNQYSVYTVV